MIVKQFKVKGYDCEIYKSPFVGHLCGYVKVAMTKEESDKIDCHGGITYNDGEIIGFDCAHAGDVVPAMEAMGFSERGTYKDQEFVEAELVKIVEQLESEK